MPHQCTTCGRDFADGSKDMLSGCPECGGTTFQYLPDGGTVVREPPAVDPPERGGSTVAGAVGRAATKARDLVNDSSNAGPGGGRPPEAGTGRSDGRDAVEPRADAAIVDGDAGADGAVEDGAQSSARREMVDPDDLPGRPRDVGTVQGSEGDGDRAGGADAGGPPPDERATAGVDELDGRTEEVVVGTRTGETPAGRVVDTPSEEAPDLADLRAKLDDEFEGIRILEPGQYELNLMELYEREETIVALRENGRYVIVPPESWHGDDRD